VTWSHSASKNFWYKEPAGTFRCGIVASPWLIETSTIPSPWQSSRKPIGVGLRHHMPIERGFWTGAIVVLILAIAFVLIVLLWPIGRLPWP
jgi:hypothetical protein